MSSNLNTRVEKLEQATQGEDPPEWVKGLCDQFGFAPEAYMIDGRYVPMDVFLDHANRQLPTPADSETAGGNKA